MNSLMIKAVVSLLAAAAVTATGLADIQQPPASDYGPTRKLGRGLGNVLWGPTELFDSMAAVNYAEGNSAAWSYGIVRGIGRSFARLGYGIYEMVTFPFPTVKGSYRPPYRSDIPWINSGYQEFPPELGFETRYHYVREYQRDPW
jgi:putative exosortase-associated protein (TIGR04073 family)